MATVRYDPNGSSKRAAVAALYIIAAIIVVLGLGFAVYSVVFPTNYLVFGMEVPGYVFAAFVAFLGVRYFLSVRKMSKSLPDSQRFSWSNFKIGSRTKKVEG